VPFGAIVLITAVWLLRKTPSSSQAKLDLMGAGLISGAISAIMLGISFMGNTQGQIVWWEVAVCFTAAVILLIMLARRLKTVEVPIIDLQVLRERPFMASNLFNFLYGIGTLGVFSFIPLYAVSVFNMSTLDSGLILTPRSIAMMVSALIVSINLVRWGYRWPMIIGTVLTVASLLGLAWEAPGISLFGWTLSATTLLIVFLFISGFAQGMVAPAANNACIELAPEKIGMITGVRGMFRQVGSAIGISLITLVVHNTGDMSRGFFLVFIGMAIISAMTVPMIMFMPRGPAARTSRS
jgi:Na+/melibiose symporter-like transporter